MDLKTQRAARIAAVKDVIRANVIRDHGARHDIEIEITDDAAIDLFGMGVLDAPDAKWQEFLQSLSESHAEHVPDDEVPAEVRARIALIP